jgi:hypothetical protein
MAYWKLGDYASGRTYYERAAEGLAEFDRRIAKSASPAWTYDPDPATLRRVREEAASLFKAGADPKAGSDDRSRPVIGAGRP